MRKILLIDNDRHLLDTYREHLGLDGFLVEVVSDGQTGLEQALSGAYELVVLADLLQDFNGLDILRRIRACSQLPVLMLAERGDSADRVIGLELGADDYVVKPCTARELSARVRAILRRTLTMVSADQRPQTLRVGALSLCPEKRQVLWAGRQLNLTSTEFDLLAVLLEHAGKPISKNHLSEQGLRRPLRRYDRSIEVHLCSLRQKLGVLSDGRSCIQTVFRQGYQLLRE